MRIAYLYQRITGDERAIVRALHTLGHEVTMVHVTTSSHIDDNHDMVLAHHPYKFDLIKKSTIPLKVCWIFDLIVDTTNYLGNKTKIRNDWFENILPHLDMVFCTDGELLTSYGNHSIYRLTQGSQATYNLSADNQDGILFAGAISEQRKSLINLLKKRYGTKFKCVTGKERVYGLDFARLVSKHKIIIAPDVPIKPNYWSNRVYMVCGYGGFLLHPYIEELEHQYTDGEEIVYYRNREDLLAKIDYYLDPANEQERRFIADNTFALTKQEHTYLHRVQKMMEIIQNEQTG